LKEDVECGHSCSSLSNPFASSNSSSSVVTTLPSLTSQLDTLSSVSTPTDYTQVSAS